MKAAKVAGKGEKNMNENKAIQCDVTKCRHNFRGCSCQLESIKVTCGCNEHQTCCGSYSEKHD